MAVDGSVGRLAVGLGRVAKVVVVAGLAGPGQAAEVVVVARVADRVAVTEVVVP